MEKTKLIDLFGMSGDPLDNDELDDLLLRLESESQNILEVNYGSTYPSPITITITSSSSGPTISFSIPKDETRIGSPLSGFKNPFVKSSLN
ncbi:MAG: hypothetical protein ABJA60_07740 [Nitrosospira sp.]